MARTDDRMEGRRVMTPDEIAADRAVIDAATDGPWTAIGQGVVHDTGACNCGPGGINGMHEPYCGAGLLADASVDDAAFIAAARTGWPRALDALEAAQEGNARLREALDEAIRHKVELDDLRRQAKAERDEARAEVEAMRRGEVDGVFTSVVHGCCERAEQAEAAIARVRARHASVPLTDPCDHEDRDACDAFETSDGEWACGPVVAHACAECRDESGELVDYPCPTIRALDRVAPMRAWGIDPGEVE